MFVKPVALPRPKNTPTLGESTSESTRGLAGIVEQRDKLSQQLGELDIRIEGIVLESICGARDDSQDVENYDGTLGVTRDFVARHERPVGQLQWVDLAARSGPADSPGSVSNARWGTGALISSDGDDLFLTAGHCFAPAAIGWILPSRRGTPLTAFQIAPLMQVNFNFQVERGTTRTRRGDPFPVLELLEYGYPAVDYAIVRLGPNARGVRPGQMYGSLTVARQDLMTPDTTLCMIQHPNGGPKKIEAGPLRRNSAGTITYRDLDAAGGSSGSTLLDPNGEIVGIHIRGGCYSAGGFNRGLAVGALRGASKLIR
jgi:hypothetical protein